MSQLPLIAVFRGGYTGERVISMQSAKRMMDAIDTTRYQALYITLTREAWTCETPNEEAVPLDRGVLSVRIPLPPSKGDDPLHVRKFDAALIAIHGAPGEDGKLQGLLDMLGIPYQTGGVLNMALSFSKYSTVSLLRQMGFAVAPSVMVHAGNDDPGRTILEQVGLPCFVKPDESGSSLGISKVKTAEELGPALAKAFGECSAVMAEGCVVGRELTCGVIRLNGHVQALPICEVRHTHEFFDYEAKYHSKDTEELVPAPLPDDVTRTVQQRSEAIYRALNCNGMVRVDHIWTGQEVYTIEVNTTPGFSGASIYPKMLEVAGIGVANAINTIIEGIVKR
ncbi:MAG: D-alanine--D-alanine ligase [Flavobacteriales bacterium]|nr:D-alanine--D-alanine ligase [Flavobacteriales bacterium]MBK7553721.1 D-alanine--D-alanine ligase [Flavobacteriales bacterium]